MGPVQAQLVETFGLVIQCGDRVGEQGMLAQAVHTLQQAVQPGNRLHPSCWEFCREDYLEVHRQVLCIDLIFVSFHFLSDYLFFQLVAHSRGLQVELSPEANKLIHGYYMASRRARTQGVKFSLASIKLL